MVTRPWTSPAKLQPDASLGKKVKQALRLLLWGCRHLGPGTRYTNLLFSLVMCAPDMDHVARLMNCRLHFKAQAPNREAFVKTWVLGAPESHWGAMSSLNWRHRSVQERCLKWALLVWHTLGAPESRWDAMSSLRVPRPRSSFAPCSCYSDAKVWVFVSCFLTNMNRIFCQPTWLQVLFGCKTCNVEVVFYTAGRYTTPEKRKQLVKNVLSPASGTRWLGTCFLLGGLLKVHSGESMLLHSKCTLTFIPFIIRVNIFTALNLSGCPLMNSCN